MRPVSCFNEGWCKHVTKPHAYHIQNAGLVFMFAAVIIPTLTTFKTHRTMKTFLPFLLALLALSQTSHEQVTRLSNNTNLSFGAPISATKAIFTQPIEGRTDYYLWVTDGTPANTFKLNIPVTLESESGVVFLNDKMYFSGLNDTYGAELWVTDGTAAGTHLVKDINGGPSSSSPKGMIAFNGNIYFFASTNADGFELYKSNGTDGGTAMLKDINTGAGGSYSDNLSYAFLNNELYFSAISATTGLELWKTNGTTGGTVPIVDINPAGSSSPEFIELYNGQLFFTANDGTHGIELWKTNGTAGGTSMVKDIATGPGNSNISGSIIFNNKLLFTAEATTGDKELYTSDGTTAGTNILKDINAGPLGSNPDVSNGVQFNNKLIFPATSLLTGRELYITDGTANGTTLFKDIVPGITGSSPDIWLDRNWFAGINNPDYSNNSTLYNGKIFFTVTSLVNNIPSFQLWVTDGTANNTVMVKDFGIGIIIPSYFYTKSGLYFGGNDAGAGNEIFKTEGTPQTTHLYADVNAGAGDSNPFFQFFTINGKVFFIADDGDSPANDWDLFVLNGTEVPLPLNLLQFSAAGIKEGVTLSWTTANERNTKDFELQRSIDGNNFSAIGTIAAAGQSNTEKDYTWLDKDAWQQKSTTLYYRLKQVDKDGRFNYSKIALIQVASPALSGLQAAPNPASKFIRLTISSPVAANAQVRILNSNGQVVKSFTTRLIAGNNQQVITLDGLAAGLYYAELTGGEKPQSTRFIKE